MTRRTEAYLDRLGLTGPLEPTPATLRAVHRAHLDALPYDNLATVLGRPPSVDPADCLRRAAEEGRAGYCFHHNAALELALVDLGFTVSRRGAHAYSSEPDRAAGDLNHLALVVDLDGEQWWADVGLGDALRDPVPLRAGRVEQGGFTYELSDVDEDGWSFRADPRGSFLGLDVLSGPVDQAAVDAAHARLSAPPDGKFTHVLVVLRRRADATDALRGCTRTSVGPAGTTTAVLSTYAGWRAALDELGLPLDGVTERELRALHAEQWARHEAWERERRA